MEIKPMKNEIETSIKLLSEKIDQSVKSEDALRFTQAVLNLAHVLGILKGLEIKTTPLWGR
jgi:hypothetical protein